MSRPLANDYFHLTAGEPRTQWESWVVFLWLQFGCAKLICYVCVKIGALKNMCIYIYIYASYLSISISAYQLLKHSGLVGSNAAAGGEEAVQALTAHWKGLQLSHNQNRSVFKMVDTEPCKEIQGRTPATIYGWDCLLLTFIYPGIDCGSNDFPSQFTCNTPRDYREFGPDPGPLRQVP